MIRGVGGLGGGGSQGLVVGGVMWGFRGGLVGGGILDWIGVVLRCFGEGHPRVTGHAARWARNFVMRTAPQCPGTRSRCLVPTFVSTATTVLPHGRQLQRPTLSYPHGPQPAPHTPSAHTRLSAGAHSRCPTHSVGAQSRCPTQLAGAQRQCPTHTLLHARVHTRPP